MTRSRGGRRNRATDASSSLLPQGSSNLEKQLLQLIDSSPDGRLLMTHINKKYTGLETDLRALTGNKSLREAISANDIPCIARVTIKTVGGPSVSYLTLSAHGLNSVNVPVSATNSAPALGAPISQAPLGVAANPITSEFPQGSSRLEKQLLAMIDTSPERRLPMTHINKQYPRFEDDLRSLMEGKGGLSLKEAFATNQLLCIKRISMKSGRGQGTSYLIRSPYGNTQPQSISVENAPLSPSDFQSIATSSDSMDLHVRSNDRAATREHDSEPRDIVLVDALEKMDKLHTFIIFDSNCSSREIDDDIVTVEWQGASDQIYFILIGTGDKTYLFDCINLGQTTVCMFLAPMFANERVTKVFHDAYKIVSVLFAVGGISVFNGCFDTQLAVEATKPGFCWSDFSFMLRHFDAEWTAWTKIKTEQYQTRPITTDVAMHLARRERAYIAAVEKIRTMLGRLWVDVQRASDKRATCACKFNGKRQVCFDMGNSYRIASPELLERVNPSKMFIPPPLEVFEETSSLFSMLKDDLVRDLRFASNITDIVLDLGRTPHAYISGQRKDLGSQGRLVEENEIRNVVHKIGNFGSDDRAGIERQLHRISALRHRDKKDDGKSSMIIGLTMRVGRHVSGNASIISDLLLLSTSKLILLLGEPGSGKTTVVREITRLLAEKYNVCIVDTSNEIAGDGVIPHPCVGRARRMMVPSLNDQSRIMVQVVQNHTPAVMVIDEIGRRTEVEAARTCRNRGVRLIASAHGDLRMLIKNPELKGLIGGVETVTLGDEQAKLEAKKHGKDELCKTKAERAGPPTFDMIVELSRGMHHSWRIILDTAQAVDHILDGKEFEAQRRVRDPTTGAIQVDTEYA